MLDGAPPGGWPVSPEDWEVAARLAMDPAHFDYFAGGAQDEVTLRENRAAWQALRLWQRALVPASPADTRTTIAGHSLASPVLVAPSAFHQLATAEGELATVRAAGAAGTVMVASTLSNRTIQDICAAASGPVWFQLYLLVNRERSRELVQRAADAGCSALVLTVDAPVLGRRERDVRNRLRLPPDLLPANLAWGRPIPDHWEAGASLVDIFDEQKEPNLSWEDVAWLRSITGLPVWLKGILHPADARRAVEAGVAGIIVSNHGGRQLDGTVPTAEALPGVLAAVDGRLPVLVDGGIRRGADVLRALALGAQGVLAGRPVLWGLAVGGEAGARQVLEQLRTELALAMTLCGVATVPGITPAVLARPWGDGTRAASP